MARKFVSKGEFLKYFDVVKREIVDHFQVLSNQSSASTKSWLEQVLDYNVPTGKLNRGLLLVHTFESLNDKRKSEYVQRICKLGWAVEFLQSSYLVADDMIDHSLTRRGRTCWYKLPDVGMKAVNDSLLLENCVDLILQRELKDKKCLGPVLKAFLETKLATVLGQHLDSQELNFLNCTRSHYADIVRMKTSHYTFLLPMLVAILVTNDDSVSLMTMNETELRNLCFQFGHYFQAHDDFLDCFGDPSVTGKIGTDIQEGKCCWLLVEALHRIKMDSDDFRVLQDNYAKSDKRNIENVKSLYRRLNLIEEYETFEKSICQDIETTINMFSSACLRDHLRNLLNSLHKRRK